MSRLQDNWNVKYQVYKAVEETVLDALEDALTDHTVLYPDKFTNVSMEGYTLENHVMMSGDRAVLSVMLNV